MSLSSLNQRIIMKLNIYPSICSVLRLFSLFLTSKLKRCEKTSPQITASLIVKASPLGEAPTTSVVRGARLRRFMTDRHCASEIVGDGLPDVPVCGLSGTPAPTMRKMISICYAEQSR